MEEEKKFLNLKKFNLVMGVIHLVQAVLMLILSNDSTSPVKKSFIVGEPGGFTYETETYFNIQLGPLVALFMFISAVAHLLLATVLYKWYVNKLGKNINHARWAEYSISSSIMIWVIAMLVGIYDIGALLLIFTLNATMIMFGWVMEIHNEPGEVKSWASYIFGCIAGAMCWVVIAMYLIFAGGQGDGPPDFVYGIFISIAIFFNIFAFNMVLQYKQVGPWKDYLYGEKVYIILSLVAKSALAWQVFSGTLV